MRWSRRVSFCHVVLVALLAAASLIAAGVAGPAHASDGVRYVALGDSRASGPTTFSVFAADGCGRSGGGYPERVARALRPDRFTDVACGGAVTDDVIDHHQQTSPPVVRTRPVQALALRPDTTLVTLSIGGNDVKWGSLISPCFGLSPAIDIHCRSDAALRQLISQRFAALSASLDRVLDVIDTRSPSARVFVVGHGGYYGLRGCFPDATISAADAPFVHEFFRRFDAVLSGAARRHGAHFVDVADAAVGHDACEPEAQRWFSGQVPRGIGLPNHSTQVGNAAIARLVLAAIRSR